MRSKIKERTKSKGDLLKEKVIVIELIVMIINILELIVIVL